MLACTKEMLRDSPGGPGVESLPANAGAMGSISGKGRSHMPQSGWPRVPAATTEAQQQPEINQSINLKKEMQYTKSLEFLFRTYNVVSSTNNLEGKK